MSLQLTRDHRAKIADVGLACVLEGERYFDGGFQGTWAYAGATGLL